MNHLAIAFNRVAAQVARKKGMQRGEANLDHVEQFRRLVAILNGGGPIETIEAWVTSYLAKLPR